jgi:hypothetical protein
MHGTHEVHSARVSCTACVQQVVRVTRGCSGLASLQLVSTQSLWATSQACLSGAWELKHMLEPLWLVCQAGAAAKALYAAGLKGSSALGIGQSNTLLVVLVYTLLCVVLAFGLFCLA